MTRRHLALLLIGFIAGIASAKSYPMSTASVELPTAWHDFAEVPDDDREFTNWWNDLGNRVKRATLEHPREELFFVGQLKTSSVRTSDAAASGKRGDHVVR